MRSLTVNEPMSALRVPCCTALRLRNKGGAACEANDAAAFAHTCRCFDPHCGGLLTFLKCKAEEKLLMLDTDGLKC